MRMQLRRSLLGVLFVCLLLVLSGCGVNNGEAVKKPRIESMREQLPTDLSKLGDLYASHGVILRSSYRAEEEVVLEVRQANKPWEALSAAQVDKLKNDIYERIGYTFELRIDSFVLPKEADITGRVTAIEGDRVLVVDKAPPGGNPNAIWVTLPEGMNSEIMIGYSVNVWSDGMVLESYPGQTRGVQLQVTEFSVGEGDLQGSITAEITQDASTENRIIEVDGTKLQLLSFTKVTENGKPVGLDRLRPGTRVQVWTLGYSIMEDQQFASQINVLKP